MNKEKQKKLITEIMEADAKDGLYKEECCTPLGRIKRYIDCVGCDKKPMDIKQKKLLTKIMAADAMDDLYEPTVSKMETTQQKDHIGDANKMVTAVEWLYRWSNDNQEATIKEWINAFEQAKEREKEQRIKDYNAGYVDAQVNHVNDAVNYVYESEYLQSRIDELDNEIKDKQDYIADMLINGDLNNKQ